MMTQMAIQLMTVFMFSAAVVLSLKNIWTLMQCRKPAPVRLTVLLICIVSALLSSLFVGANVQLLRGAWDQPQGDALSWFWTVFHYLTSIFVLSVATFMEIYCKWRGSRHKNKESQAYG